MQQKLCLWLCAAVLLGALGTGNPFLCASPGSATRGEAPEASSPVRPRVGVEAAPAPGGVVMALETRPANEGLSARKALQQGTAAPAVVPVALRAPVPAEASGLLCPDAALRDLVSHTERSAGGATIWVLRDGRRFWRNPDAAGHPVLVPCADNEK